MGLQATVLQQSLKYQQFTNLSSAISLGGASPSTPATGTAGIPDATCMAVVYVEGAGVRWRDDGAAPTAAIGMPVASGAALTFTDNLPRLQFIQQTAGAILNVMYYQSL